MSIITHALRRLLIGGRSSATSTFASPIVAAAQRSFTTAIPHGCSPLPTDPQPPAAPRFSFLDHEWMHINLTDELRTSLARLSGPVSPADGLDRARPIVQALALPGREPAYHERPTRGLVWTVPSGSGNEVNSSTTGSKCGAAGESMLWQMTPSTPPAFWIPLGNKQEYASAVLKSFEDLHGGPSLVAEELFRSNLLNAFDDDQRANPIPTTKPDSNTSGDSSAVDSKDSDDSDDSHMDFFVKMNPALVNPFEHPKTVRLFLGMTDEFPLLETSFLINPFCFSPPLLLGSVNSRIRETPVLRSTFRSIASRSLITLEAFEELKTEYDSPSGSVFPVYAVINYPDTFSESSKLCKEFPEEIRLYNRVISSINETFEVDFPPDLPLDIAATFIGFKLKNYHSFHREILTAEHNKVDPHPVSLAQCAILQDPNFDQLFLRYYQHPERVIRVSLYTGAMFLQLDHCMRMAGESEQDPELAEHIRAYLTARSLSSKIN